ncbi:CHASE3 domain-containing protein, partial [Salmonella enterica]|uniref:CHASE3 domain-containing protein n=1 Tax=Salmonella enterica TaxID=28901 RepID=UPI003D27A823
LLSGEDAYLEPFNAAEGKFDKAARELGEKITPGSEQQDRLKGVAEAKKGWIEGPAVEEMMARRKLSRGMIDNQAFTAIFKTSKGKELSDKVRTLVG